MKAITIHQHWANAIFDHGKDVENRTWKTKYRGDLLIHTGSSKASLTTSKDWINNFSSNGIKNPDFGFIIGKVTLVDCITNSYSNWAMLDHYHWVLSYPVRCVPYRIKGKLGLWDFNSNVLTWSYQQVS